MKTVFASKAAIAAALRWADLVIGAVLVPGAAAPKLVACAMLKTMEHGAALVDIAMDQGGCFETSRATTYELRASSKRGLCTTASPTCRGPWRGPAPQALNNATLPFVLAIASQGAQEVLASNPHLTHGLNVASGAIGDAAVAEALDLPFAA